MPVESKVLATSFTLVFLLLIGAVQASVVHRVRVERDKAEVTSLLELTSQEEVNKWELTLELPQNSEVESIQDSRGNVSYEQLGKQVKFETNSGPLRREEKVRLNFTVRDVINEKFWPLETAELNLFGFSNETIKAEVSADHLISWNTPFRFRSQRLNSSLRFEGEGSLPLQIYLSEKGNQSEHYHYFKNGKISQAEDYFSLLSYLTGLESPYDKFPTLFLNDSRYDSLVNNWSSGRYRNGGLLLVRENLSSGKIVSTILHESMHGFDARFLKWDRTRTAYFDEGMAKFVEFLARQQMNAPQAEIFGERVYFERDGKRYYLKSRFSPDELWNYYRNGEDWMLRWSPWQDVGQKSREFGYAYAELLIRDYVRINGMKSLRNVSRELLKIDHKVEDWSEKSRILSQALGNLRPCYSQDRDEFERCLEQINAQEFNLTDLNLTLPLGGEKEGEINITPWKFEIPKRKPGLRQNLLSQLQSWFSSLLERIGWILEKL